MAQTAEMGAVAGAVVEAVLGGVAEQGLAACPVACKAVPGHAAEAGFVAAAAVVDFVVVAAAAAVAVVAVMAIGMKMPLGRGAEAGFLAGFAQRRKGGILGSRRCLLRASSGRTGTAALMRTGGIPGTTVRADMAHLPTTALLSMSCIAGPQCE